MVTACRHSNMSLKFGGGRLKPPPLADALTLALQNAGQITKNHKGEEQRKISFFYYLSLHDEKVSKGANRKLEKEANGDRKWAEMGWQGQLSVSLDGREGNNLTHFEKHRQSKSSNLSVLQIVFQKGVNKDAGRLYVAQMRVAIGEMKQAVVPTEGKPGRIMQ